MTGCVRQLLTRQQRQAVHDDVQDACSTRFWSVGCRALLEHWWRESSGGDPPPPRLPECTQNPANRTIVGHCLIPHMEMSGCRQETEPNHHSRPIQGSLTRSTHNKYKKVGQGTSTATTDYWFCWYGQLTALHGIQAADEVLGGLALPLPASQ